eukprot:6463178-Prymnesium_polylepis.1
MTIAAGSVGLKSPDAIACSSVFLYCAPIADLNWRVKVRNLFGSVENTRPASAALLTRESGVGGRPNAGPRPEEAAIGFAGCMAAAACVANARSNA